MDIGKVWNYISRPEVVPRLFALFLCLIMIVEFFIPTTYNENQLYPKCPPQSQIFKSPLAPYDRGGEPLKKPADIKTQYPQFEPIKGKITAYLTPPAIWISKMTPYFGTTIVSTPGGILDEILYYTRGLDTVLESLTLLISFIIFSWVYLHREKVE
ncbi:EhaF family protein [Methanofervidicoccus abyssi]|uniref:Energy-converting hydrogenase A subunit F n=1 Tax=Methanofervidicoccus abyssi TaxID=2082189 RepID=A0A401HS19_9EURY|nr:energy-converting hydrogenase A subunit F [Methanofervidicoccus abyssi]